MKVSGGKIALTLANLIIFASLYACWFVMGPGPTDRFLETASTNAVLVLTNLLIVAPLVTFILYRIRGRLLKLTAVKSILKTKVLPQSIEAARKKSRAKIRGLLAIHTADGRAIYICGRLYILTVLTTLWPSLRVHPAPSVEIWLRVWIWPLTNFIIFPAILVPSHIMFRLLFMGSLSKYPRKLSGLAGTWGEFISFAIISVHMLALIALFSPIWHDPIGTFKPHWADWLG